jgi:hypothetical protein
MRDSPLNPLASSYSGAFIAAYLSAAGIIEANKRNFTTHPLLFTRWYVVHCLLGRSETDDSVR